jgi:hypothetical protein
MMAGTSKTAHLSLVLVYYCGLVTWMMAGTSKTAQLSAGLESKPAYVCLCTCTKVCVCVCVCVCLSSWKSTCFTC